MHTKDQKKNQHWHLDEINFDAIQAELVHNDQFLFLTLASASFVEILSETYAGNLIQHYQGDAEITDWLRNNWQRDEVQHGQALKRYVQIVWPEFNWEKAYEAFRLQYSALCTMEQLEQRKGLELLARCVIETGTSSFYRAMQSYVREPVLQLLLEKIKVDETAHYAHFRRYFDLYNRRDQYSLAAIMATIWRRLRDIGGEDAYIAFKHVYEESHSESQSLNVEWRFYNQKLKQLARHHYPYRLAVKMLIKPVPLFEPLKKILQWPLIGMALLISTV
jgi:rubrerythrin